MEMTIAGAEQVACTIFERLGLELAGAQLDYESFNGIHNFIITHAGTRFRIQFAEQTLLTRSMEQLEETVCKIASECCATLPFGHVTTRIATMLRVCASCDEFRLFHQC